MKRKLESTSQAHPKVPQPAEDQVPHLNPNFQEAQIGPEETVRQNPTSSVNGKTEVNVETAKGVISGTPQQLAPHTVRLVHVTPEVIASRDTLRPFASAGNEADHVEEETCASTDTRSAHLLHTVAIPQTLF